MIDGEADSARPRPPLLPSEAPFRVFVSGVQDAEMQPFRESLVRSFESGYIIPWVFEHTPAVPGDVQETYLAKVRESDLVFWLVGSGTTEPVRRELEEALAVEKKILVFRLQVATRDELTQQTTTRLRNVTKYVDIQDPDDLVRHARLAVEEFLISAARGRPGASKVRVLEGLRRASAARMIEKWLAADVEPAVAEALANDTSVGAPRPEHRATPSRPVVVIAAEIGSGKSLIAERLYGEAVEIAATTTAAPIPVLIEGLDFVGTLEAAVRARAEGLGNPSEVGATVIFDGADETEVPTARLLAQARVLARAWPSTTVIITTRPVAELEDVQEVVTILPLSPDEVMHLVAKLQGPEAQRFHLYGWPKSVQDAASRPLFAALLASSRRHADLYTPASKADLIAGIIRRAIERRRLQDVSVDALIVLAYELTRRGVHLVPRSQVGDDATVRSLWRSGLLVERRGSVGFALAIFQEWFAAQSLLRGKPSPDELLANQGQLDRWRNALALAVVTSPFAATVDVLSALARSRPAFAAMVIHDAVPPWGLDETVPAPPRDDCGRQIRTASAAWGIGLSGLARRLIPIDKTKRVKPIGVYVDGPMLVAGWYLNPDHPADVLPFELGPNPFGPSVRSFGSRSLRPGRSPAWAWRWSLEDARSHLDSILRYRSLPLAKGPLLDETMWRFALGVQGYGSLHADPIPLSDLARTVAGLPESEVVSVGRHEYDASFVNDFKRRIEELRFAGIDALTPPFIAPDLPRTGGYVWAVYSPEATERHVRGTHERALVAYNQLVDVWFPRMAADLHMRQIQPFRFVGRIKPADPSMTRSWQSAGMDYYVLPLATGDATNFDIRCYREGEPKVAHGSDLFDEIDAAYEKNRPDLTVRSGTGSTLLPNPAPRPATNLAYRWLIEDLNSVHWTKEHSGFDWE